MATPFPKPNKGEELQRAPLGCYLTHVPCRGPLLNSNMRSYGSLGLTMGRGIAVLGGNCTSF